MKFLYRLAIALFRLLFGSMVRPRPRMRRSSWLTDKTQTVLTPTPLPGRERGFKPKRLPPPLLPHGEKGWKNKGQRFVSQPGRSRLHSPKFTSNNAYKYEEYDDLDSNDSDSPDYRNTLMVGHNNHLATHPYSLTINNYSPLYQPIYYPHILQWQGINDEYDQDYQDEYEDDYEEDLNDSYGTIEYRFETFGSDTFIEYSYEGNLDEQEILQALNWLWTSSADRSNPNRTNVLTGTLRIPLLSRRSIGLPYVK